MPMTRVQFQPGLWMPEFLARYGSEERCKAALPMARWPKGFACPLYHAVAHTISPRRPPVLEMRGMSPPVQRHQRHAL